MTALSQDFTIYSGDGKVMPIFTVRDGAGAIINISSVTQIQFTMQRDLSSAPVITKTKTGGGISFVTDGSDGQFQVILQESDTTPLGGFYIHEASITDVAGNLSTVATGRVNVGRAPVWSYSGDPTSSDKDAVRYLVGDIIATDQLVTDPEILFALTQRTTTYGAAATVLRSLAGKVARLSDVVDREMRTQLSAQARNYTMMANQYENQARVRGGALPYAGGISVADKISQQTNPDRVTPQFQIGMTDDLIPVFPAGNETEISDQEANV